MEIKKNSSVNLEKRKGVIFQIGMVIALAGVLTMLEYTKIDVNSGLTGNVDMDEDLTETMIEFEEPPPIEEEIPVEPEVQAPPPVIEDIVIIDDPDDQTDIFIDPNIDIIIPDDPIIIEPVIDDVIYEIVEEQPEYMGGIKEMYKYLKANVKYPAMDKENGIQGKVYVNFVVGKDGSIDQVKVLRSVSNGLDKEAMRVVKNMPKWKPGKQMNKPVKVRFTLPIKFILN